MKWSAGTQLILGILLLGGAGILVALNLPKRIPGGECNCVPLSQEEAVRQADLIFRGTLTYATTNWISGGMKYSFRVDQAWKRRSDVFTIVNSGWEQDCGVAFQVGEEYWVFVNKKFSLQTNRCNGTVQVSQNPSLGAALAQLPESEIEASPQVRQMFWVIGLLGLFSVLFVAAVVLRKFFKRS